MTWLDPELVIFEGAINRFNAGQFESAKKEFAKLTSACNRDLAHSAELRIRIFEQRLAPALPLREFPEESLGTSKALFVSHSPPMPCSL